MILLSKVKQFMRNLLDTATSRLFKKVQEQHLRIINDKSYLLQSESGYFTVSYYCRYLVNYFRKLRLFMPDAHLIRLWNFYMLMIYIFEVVVSILKATFEWSFYETNYKFIPVLFVLSSIGHLLINVNSGHIENGFFITSRRRIIKKYV